MLLSNVSRWLTIAAGLLAATLIQAAEPVLLQGAIESDPEPVAWYNSRDPEVLISQIHLLETTVRDQRRSLKQLETRLDEAKYQNAKLQRKLDKKTVKAAPERIPSPLNEAMQEELLEARRRILDLETALAEAQSAAAQAAQTTPTAAAPANTSQINELKALVRTYEKTIASLESDLQAGKKQLASQDLAAEEKDNTIASLQAAMDDATDADMPETEEPEALEPAALEPAALPEEDSAVSISEIMAVTEAAEQLDAPTAPAPAPQPAAEPEEDPAPAPAPVMDTTGDETSATALVNEGFALLLTGQTEEAEEIFSAIGKDDDNFARAQLGLATVDYSRDDLAAAKLKVSAILDKEPDNPQALGLNGIISWREGRITEADRLLSRAIALDDQDAQLYNYQAIILHARGDYLAAEHALETAIALDPDHPEAHFNLAVLNTIGPIANRTKAQEYYEKAVLLGSQRDPKFEASLYRQ